MSRRTDQRRAAAFALYQHELTSRELDELISRFAEGWSLQRIAPLERSILRVSLLEMLHPEDVPASRPIPPEGAISEAVETAKSYCGAEAPGFVNGILAAVLREMHENSRTP